MAEAMMFGTSTVSLVDDAPLAIISRERFQVQGTSRQDIAEYQQFERALREEYIP